MAAKSLMSAESSSQVSSRSYAQVNRYAPCIKTVTFKTRDQSVPASFKTAATFWIQSAVSFRIPPGTTVLLTVGT